MYLSVYEARGTGLHLLGKGRSRLCVKEIVRIHRTEKKGRGFKLFMGLRCPGVGQGKREKVTLVNPQ